MDTPVNGGTSAGVATKPKYNGINLPQDVYDDVERILRIELRVHDAMDGGGHGPSRSDIVSRALREFVDGWKTALDLPLDQPVPEEASDALVRRAGEHRLNTLRAKLKRKAH
jgi:hypothetical protein